VAVSEITPDVRLFPLRPNIYRNRSKPSVRASTLPSPSISIESSPNVLEVESNKLPDPSANDPNTGCGDIQNRKIITDKYFERHRFSI
jgi:hypothetical protein